MANDNKEKNKKFTKKYRFAIMDDESHEYLFMFKSNRLIMSLATIIIFIFLIASVVLVISYTPVKHLIPGFPSKETNNIAMANIVKIDSLENEIEIWKYQLNNIQLVLAGKDPISIESIVKRNNNIKSKHKHIPPSKSDSILRTEVKEKEQFEILDNAKDIKIEQIEGLVFFPPIKGAITQDFSKGIGHPFIDIAAQENSAVSSILDGTVIFASWNDRTGYTIQIQHSNNLISIYKHNAKLLKKAGDKVKAGTSIAIVGNTGSLSTGVHLHFELWHKGEPIDPTLYINF